MQTDISFGIIPLRKTKDKWELFLVQHNSDGFFWGFPKGHLEAGEDQKTCAQRELFEETGLKVLSFFSNEPLYEKYFFFRKNLKINKENYYFLAKVTEDAHITTNELLQGKWFSLQEAENQIGY